MKRIPEKFVVIKWPAKNPNNAPIDRLVVLCNDGTMWLSDADKSWFPIAEIPQP